MLVTALLAAGCASGPSGNSGGSFGSTQSRGYAEELSQLGDHTGAAAQYLELANSSEGVARNRYLILAARERHLANDTPAAERMLAQIEPVLTDVNQSLWSMVSAEVKLGTGQPNQALNALNRIPETDPDYNAPRVRLLKAEALFRLGRAEDAVTVLMQREDAFRSKSDKLENQKLVYAGLQTAGSNLPSRPNASDPVVNGWLVLGYLSYQQRDNVTGLRQALQEWTDVYPDHPAARGIVPELLDEIGAMLNYPERVAVLLPLSGRTKATAEAIREGLLAAHFNLGDLPERPELVFYDTATADGALGAFEKAMRDEADFIIGPLLKEAVDEVATMSPPVTTLTLNNTSSTVRGFGSARLYQFPLSPEDEAAQVARRAISEGHRKAIVMVPDTAWGQRVLDSFAAELNRYGGNLLSAVTYTSDTQDYSPAIQEMLLLDESKQRHQQLQNTLSQTLEFEPRVREDAEFIFLAANNKTAKQIRPQLRYQYAGGFPTYATSAVFQPGTKAAPDLRNITFPDAPWVLGVGNDADNLKGTVERRFGSSSLRRMRFYAMGYDAYRMVPLLNNPREPMAVPLNGLSGKLSLDRGGRIHRELSWAYIQSNGYPRPLPETPKLILDSTDTLLSAE